MIFILFSVIFKSIILVLSVGEQGYLEGRCKEVEGWFPSNHVQDICLFSKFYFYFIFIQFYLSEIYFLILIPQLNMNILRKIYVNNNLNSN